MQIRQNIKGRMIEWWLTYLDLWTEQWDIGHLQFRGIVVLAYEW